MGSMDKQRPMLLFRCLKLARYVDHAGSLDFIAERETLRS